MNINSVFLKDMPFHLSIGKDAWQREDKPQPVNITLRVDNVDSINDVATTDDISKSLDYGKLYKSIQSNLNPKTSYSNIQQIAHFVLASLIANSHDISGEIQIKLPKAALRAEGGLEYVFGSNRDQGPTIEHEFLHIRGIKCACIIGVNPHERRDKQIVIVNLTFRGKYGTASDSTVAGSNPSAADVAMNTHHEIVETVVEVRQPIQPTWTTLPTNPHQRPPPPPFFTKISIASTPPSLPPPSQIQPPHSLSLISNSTPNPPPSSPSSP